MTTPRQLAAGITYFPGFVGDPDAALVEVLEQVEFTQRHGRMFGRSYRVPRREAWYGSHDYHFNDYTFAAQELPPVLKSLEIASSLAITLKILPNGWRVHPEFNGVLVNHYHDGSDSVSWHSDDEPDMGDPIIASISLGATRTFKLRRKHPAPLMASAMLPSQLSIELEHGSLLVMGRGVQAEWEHCIPKQRARKGERVNLTMRAR